VIRTYWKHRTNRGKIKYDRPSRKLRWRDALRIVRRIEPPETFAPGDPHVTSEVIAVFDTQQEVNKAFSKIQDLFGIQLVDNTDFVEALVLMLDDIFNRDRERLLMWAELYDQFVMPEFRSIGDQKISKGFISISLLHEEMLWKIRSHLYALRYLIDSFLPLEETKTEEPPLWQ
jgi:hypothetical protein